MTEAEYAAGANAGSVSPPLTELPDRYLCPPTPLRTDSEEGSDSCSLSRLSPEWFSIHKPGKRARQVTFPVTACNRPDLARASLLGLDVRLRKYLPADPSALAMASRLPARSRLGSLLGLFRRGHPVFKWGVVGVLVFGLLGVASFYAVGPFAVLACDLGPQLSVREAHGEPQGVTPYEYLTDPQQRLFDRARTAEGYYSLNESERGIEKPQYVEYKGTVYAINHVQTECTFETNHLLGVSLLAASALLGIAITIWNRRHST